MSEEKRLEEMLRNLKFQIEQVRPGDLDGFQQGVLSGVWQTVLWALDPDKWMCPCNIFISRDTETKEEKING